MISLVFESFWLWYLAGVALWAFLGALVAVWFDLPVLIGALAGAFGWFLGVAIITLVGVVRRGAGRSAARRTAPTRFPAAPPILFSDWPPADVTHPVPSQAGGYYSFGSAVATSPVASNLPVAQPPARRFAVRVDASVFALSTAIGGAVLMLVSAFLPWGNGRVAWLHEEGSASGSLSPISSGPVALAIIVSALVALAGGALAWRSVHPAWPAVVAMTTTFWFCVVVQWVVLNDGLSSAAEAGNGLASGEVNVSVGTSIGLWTMFLACVIAYVWCATVAMRLACDRRLSASAGFSTAMS